MSSDSSLDANKALSRRLYEEVFGHGNLSAADEILSQDQLTYGPGAPPQVGTDPIKEQAVRLRTAMPDFRVTLHDQIAEGDRVVSRWTGFGTHTGPFDSPRGALQATGDRISFDEIRIDRFLNGKIVESWLIPDRLTLWQQLGLIQASN
jgi:predicted ester cyclase